MRLFLVVLLIYLDGAAVLAMINCASGTLYKEGEARDDAATVESISFCSFSISSKTIPCNITTAEITVDVVSSKPRPGCNRGTSEIKCYCVEDLCNKSPETIYKLLSNTDWSDHTDGEALAHCGLEVIKEKYGYHRTTTETISTTRAATAFSTTDSDPNGNNSGVNGGLTSTRESKVCQYEGMVERSSLYTAIGVIAGLIVVLLAATGTVLYVTKQKTAERVQKMEVLAQEMIILQKELLELKEYDAGQAASSSLSLR